MQVEPSQVGSTHYVTHMISFTRLPCFFSRETLKANMSLDTRLGHTDVLIYNGMHLLTCCIHTHTHTHTHTDARQRINF